MAGCGGHGVGRTGCGQGPGQARGQIIGKSDIERPWLAGPRNLTLFRNAQPLETPRETEPPANLGAAAPGNGGCPASDRAPADRYHRPGPGQPGRDGVRGPLSLCSMTFPSGHCATAQCAARACRRVGAARGHMVARLRNCDRTHPTVISQRSHRIPPGCYLRATVRQIASLLSRATLSL
jgi:hypothetical protein